MRRVRALIHSFFEDICASGQSCRDERFDLKTVFATKKVKLFGFTGIFTARSKLRKTINPRAQPSRE